MSAALSAFSSVTSELTLPAHVSNTLQSLLLDNINWSWNVLNRTLQILQKKNAIKFNKINFTNTHQCEWSLRVNSASLMLRVSQIFNVPSSPPVTKWQCLFGLQSMSRISWPWAASIVHAQWLGSRMSYDRMPQSYSTMNWLPWWCCDHFPVENFGEFFALISATTRVWAGDRSCSSTFPSTTVASNCSSDGWNSVVLISLP